MTTVWMSQDRVVVTVLTGKSRYLTSAHLGVILWRCSQSRLNTNLHCFRERLLVCVAEITGFEKVSACCEL